MVSLAATGDGNFAVGLSAAIALLSSSVSSGQGSECTSVFLLLTDGRPSDGLASLGVLQQASVAVSSLSLVVYTLGSVLDPVSIPLQLSCISNAISIHVRGKGCEWCCSAAECLCVISVDSVELCACSLACLCMYRVYAWPPSVLVLLRLYASVFDRITAIVGMFASALVFRIPGIVPALCLLWVL